MTSTPNAVLRSARRRVPIRRPVINVLGLMTLGSGLLNLVTAAGRTPPGARSLLRAVFPLEFLHISRFLLVLIGFTMAVASVHIFRRKRRAFQLVLALSFLSVLFHLTRGLDYPQAAFSLALALALLALRRSFTVGSAAPHFRTAVIRLGIGLGAVAIYGTVGFWLLDRRDFGVAFNWGESLRQTLATMTFVGGPDLIARTAHAARFLRSLRVIAVAAILYALYEVFRPVFYRVRTRPLERARASAILKDHGRSSLDAFKVGRDKDFFFAPSGRAFLAYRMAGRFAVVLGDPVGPDEEIPPTVRGFRDLCDRNDWRAAFHQTLPDFLTVYRQAGFKKLKIGDEAVVDLAGFSLDGKRMKHLRHEVNQLEKTGVRAVWHDPPLAAETMAAVREVSDDWLRMPGRRERGFTQGVFDAGEVRETSVFAAVDDAGRVLAFMNVIPSFAPGETTIDLMRHRRDAPEGVMDFLFVNLFRRQAEAGFRRFSLGMAPMSGFREGEEAAGEERLVQAFLQRLNFLFRYEGLLQYKAKFATSWEPRYAVYRNVLDLTRLTIALARVSERAGKRHDEDL